MDSEKLYGYKLLKDAYYGTGLFSVGRGLVRHPRESTPKACILPELHRAYRQCVGRSDI